MKQAGAPCPSCHERCPAEYAQMGQPPRWICHACGAGGLLGGEFAGRRPAPAPQPQLKKHWSDRSGKVMT